MDTTKNKQFIDTIWDDSIIPTLTDYIRIPNKSPMFDPKWQEHGHMDAAVTLLSDWCLQNAIKGMKLDIIRLPQRTPVIFIEIPGNIEETILLYGHLDKQPQMTGWDEDLGPWKPVLKDDKLYGRGGADDGYAVFASLAAINSLHQQNLPHARCIILIEACEESGSYDLPFYIEALEDRIGDPSLIICLDSGCGNYDQLWMTTSLRGLVGGVLHIDILKEGVHSGTGSGVAPSCFMVLRQLLDRIEYKSTGEILLRDLFVEVPSQRLEQITQTATILKENIYKDLPFKKDVKPTPGSTIDHILNRTWRPALSIIGADGLPSTENAGNVTLPSLKIKLSMRLAPTCDAQLANQLLKNTLEKDPPFSAMVKFEIKEFSSGWNAPEEMSWLSEATKQASKNYFGADAAYMGEGGSIPFMGMLGKKFPRAQFVITGVLGPQSNAHGPNEFLHIPTGKKLTCCIAEVIEEHYMFFKNNQ
jgi:acetylornithine deacetylase/succinyl-diaminopimelate desuccinylase-like protein